MKVLLVSIALEFPLATYSLAAQLQASERLSECQVDLLNLDWQRLSSYERKNAEIWRYIAYIERTRPDLLGFSVYLWNHLPFRELARITRLVFPAIDIAVGGPEISTLDNAASWLEDGTASVAVRGEGEDTLTLIVERRAGGDDTRGIPGTSAVIDGEIVHERPAAPIRDLGTLASPFLEGLVAPELFERTGAAPGSGYPRALIETYRGCYMHCAYCQWGKGSANRYCFPTQRLYRELTWLLENNVRTVFVVDAMFGYKKATAIELLEFIVAEKQRLGAVTVFNVYHNQDYFDPRLFDLYREAGVYIELDLQSTNTEVLARLGRQRWSTDSFERHLSEIRSRRIPTTGASDLIIGIPGDNLDSFERSVDFLLSREMRVNLYHASVLPDTAWSREAVSEGTVFSPLPPRAILHSAGFPVGDMIGARLIGHGTDFFNSFPRTAALLWRRWYRRPVDLCRALGEIAFAKFGVMYGDSHQYDWAMRDYIDRLPELVRELCPDPEMSEILIDLMRFEGALAAVAWDRSPRLVIPAPGWTVAGADWLEARPRFRREAVERIEFRFAVGSLAAQWDSTRDPDVLGRVREHPHAGLFFSDGRAQHRVIDLGFTDRLLCRFNGYFTVREALANARLGLPDMALAWSVLDMLAEAGLIVPGSDDEADARSASAKCPPMHAAGSA